MGGDVRVLSGLKRRAELGLITAPDIHYSVIIGGAAFFADRRTVSSAKGRTPGHTDWMRAVTDETDFDALVLRSLGTGATGLKAYAEMTPPQLRALAAAAARHDMPLWSHAYHRDIPPSEVVEAGVDVISHAPYLAAEVVPDFHAWHRRSELPDELTLTQSMDPAAYDALFDAMQSRGTLLDATLAVFELGRDRDASRQAMYRHARLFSRLAARRGIPLVAGTDIASDVAGLPFPAVHYELELLVEEAGLAASDALRAATLNGARALGREAELGSVEAGKLANLLLLRDNPLERIEATRTPLHVIKRGAFVYRGSDPRLPFSDVHQSRRGIYLSGQIGNLPGTLTLVGAGVAAQTRQAMRNIGYLLEDYDLGYEDITRCTLMLADIADWSVASEAYLEYFNPPLPARSAFAADGLALGARVEIECQADP
jgi:enamine deaminase RidA (YjgF/YER057c/UK114 family)